MSHHRLCHITTPCLITAYVISLRHVSSPPVSYHYAMSHHRLCHITTPCLITACVISLRHVSQPPVSYHYAMSHHRLCHITTPCLITAYVISLRHVSSPPVSYHYAMAHHSLCHITTPCLITACVISLRHVSSPPVSYHYAMSHHRLCHITTPCLMRMWRSTEHRYVCIYQHSAWWTDTFICRSVGVSFCVYVWLVRTKLKLQDVNINTRNHFALTQIWKFQLCWNFSQIWVKVQIESLCVRAFCSQMRWWNTREFEPLNY